MIQPMTDQQMYEFFFDEEKARITVLETFIEEQLKKHTKLRTPYTQQQLKRHKIILCTKLVRHITGLRNDYWLERNGKKIGNTYLDIN